MQNITTLIPECVCEDCLNHCFHIRRHDILLSPKDNGKKGHFEKIK